MQRVNRVNQMAPKAPSLLFLTMEVLKTELLREDDLVPVICQMPLELFDILLTHLPPLGLQKLKREMPFDYWNDYGSTYDCSGNEKKRGRMWKFNTAWKILFKKRWPQIVHHTEPNDWEQMYWEAHLQSCLDEAAEVAVLPSFDGFIGDIKISGALLKHIGYEEQMNHSTCEYSMLYHHCQQFGCYTRSLRLQNVLCVDETCQLLKNSVLQSLIIVWVRSKRQVNSLSKLISQNLETLTSLEFRHCKLCAFFVHSICRALYDTSLGTHRIRHFSITASSLNENSIISHESSLSSVTLKLISFLSTGRSLHSLKFSDSHLDQFFGRLLFRDLVEASCGLSILDLSGNNLTGWLSKINRGSPSDSLFPLQAKTLQSLRFLNLRGNNLRKVDAEDLRYALLIMPNLESLDISDNPIEDDGIRSLISYFNQVSEKSHPLAKLNLENCDLSCDGVIALLDMLSKLRKPLNSLSIADNVLGSQVASALAKFLDTSIQVLNIGGIGLGSSGFRALEAGIQGELKLVNIDISKNRGGLETAKFLSKLMSCASELVEVNAGYNLMPSESLSIICSTLKVSKGHLQRVDLMGNNWDHQPAHVHMVAEFQHKGQPIVILPSPGAADVPYDGDP
ncbi:NACHT, LRR and PYD domains-containing protein 14 isoform X2 [Mangifera indica]|uniref:NACHT, LRR and PYD domains-containing protein 14 isoform X2 n=1 Tax=Mangifera indica TaxID=29780 RepID=UPI001CFBD894|nr:NACHT, LRR and PYD domains-containing protein 14 isoform X2 [Mangifera indica]